jgi:hypothetical protein
MSGKNNVNPDHYKVAGRDKRDDNIPPRRPGAPVAGKKRGRRRGPKAPNFIPGAPAVGEPERPESPGEDRGAR